MRTAAYVADIPFMQAIFSENVFFQAIVYRQFLSDDVFDEWF